MSTINITRINSKTISFKCKDTLPGKMPPGHLYSREFNEHTIPLKEWDKFRSTLPDDVAIVIPTIHNAALQRYLQQFEKEPDITFRLHDKQISVTLRPNSPWPLISKVEHINGARYILSGERYTIPHDQAHNVADFTDFTISYYDSATRDFIVNAIEERQKFENIHEIDVSSFTCDLNGYTPREFQRRGVLFMELTGGKAILGDQMGLGKTLQSLAYAIRGGYRTLIVCPAALKTNWEREIAKFSPSSRILTLSGREPSETDLVELMVNKQFQFTIINYDILGWTTKYEEIVHKQTHDYKIQKERQFWVEIINRSRYDLVIFDEAHKMGNLSSNRTKAGIGLQKQRVVALSGTPFKNRPSELYPILTIVRPDLFPNQESFLRQYTDHGRPKNVDQLHDTLKPVLLRRTREDVHSELPAVNNIIEYYELSEKARELYTKVQRGVWEYIDKWNGERSRKAITHILEGILRMKQICAFDKTEFTSDMATEIYDGREDDDKWKKVLVFSQFIPTCYDINSRLSPESVIITGEYNQVDRTKSQDRFQSNNDIHYLVGNPHACGEGLNLTAAGSVIFNDLLWNPAAHEQAISRAFGREGDLHVGDAYYVITKDSIEEWIYELLQAKQEAFDTVIEGVEESRGGSVFVNLLRKIKSSL